MKKLLLILPLLILSGCNISEDCIRNSGAMRTKVLPADSPFNVIYVYPNISLVLSEGDHYAITVSAGSNVIDDISAEIIDGRLELRDNSGCNLTRQYGNKTVHVTTPHWEYFELYSNTAQLIRTEGVITHDIFRMFSMDYFGGTGTGDFDMQINNNQTVIESNNISRFSISGQADNMFLNFYDDLGRFDGENFHVRTIDIFQRSSNDMIVYPIERLAGTIYSTGNVISKNHPPEIEVEQIYTGRLIFD